MTDLMPDIIMPDDPELIEEEVVDVEEEEEEVEEEEVVEPLVVKEITPDEEIFKDAPIKLNKNGKPKRKCSEHQLQKLKEAREKSALTRQRKKDAKMKESNEYETVLAEEKQIDLLEKKAKNEARRLKLKNLGHVEDPMKATPAPAPAPTPSPAEQAPEQLTREDILRIQEDAINSYEEKRLSAKQKRKEQELKQRNIDAIQRAIKPNSPWEMMWE